MTIEAIRELIQGPQYAFLRSEEQLKGRIVLLTLAGSDVDLRGCALPRPRDLLGFGRFEQFVDQATDTTIYAFGKLVSLLIGCNPNTIELLGCLPEHYLVLTEAGRAMVENRHMFLSKRAAGSFTGYATQQLRRLENALARDLLPQAKKEEHILRSMENAKRAFARKYTDMPEGSILLRTDKSGRAGLDREIFADITLKHFPARQFNGIIADLEQVIRSYEKLNHRNHKKDDNHLNKHAMHLIRLYLTGLDILEKEEIITYRRDDLELLRSIRRGDFQKEDGTFRGEFFEMVNAFEQRFEYAVRNTSLPEEPDLDRIEELVMEVNRGVAAERDS